MSMINIGLTAIPGEAAIVAIANMIQGLAEGQTPDQKKLLWDRYIEISAPWQAIAVEISKDAATFVAHIMGIMKPPTK